MKDYKTVAQQLKDVKTLFLESPCSSSYDTKLVGGLDSVITVLDMWDKQQEEEIEAQAMYHTSDATLKEEDSAG